MVVGVTKTAAKCGIMGPALASFDVGRGRPYITLQSAQIWRSSLRKLLGSVVVLAVILLAPAGAFAQGTTSRVAGTVTDKSGGVIPGASVTLTSDATAIKLATTTNDSGSYAFEAVQVGRYTVTVELQGFKRFVAPDVPVAIGEPTTVNAVLEPGGIAESVVVTAASQVVQTGTSGNLGSTFDQRTIESLPILGGARPQPARPRADAAWRRLGREHRRRRTRERRARPVLELHARRHRYERVERRRVELLSAAHQSGRARPSSRSSPATRPRSTAATAAGRWR